MRFPRPAAAWPVLLGLTLAPVGPVAAQEQDYQDILRFASAGPGGALRGWSGGPAGTLFLDSAVTVSPPYAGRLQRGPDSEGGASALTFSLPLTFAGDTLELRGWLRMEGVEGFAGLWLREDGPGGPVQFDNMQGVGLRGSAEWARYSVRLPLDDRARTVFLGALLVGEGTVWVDDLELLVDGAPVSEAPALVRVPTAVELDDEFDGGSGIEAVPLTPVQVGNLVLLGKVWGFVKYHHPRVAGGEVNWDYELFRVLPSVLEAGDRAAAAGAMSAWLAGLGSPEPCEACSPPPPDAHLVPDLDWVRDTASLGAELSGWLERIHEGRSATEEQYYVAFQSNVGNPDFSNEEPYADFGVPDAGFRLLALYRFWSIIEYWFPYRDVMDEDWEAVLREFVPRLMAVDDEAEYRLELMQLSARVHDTHANLWPALGLRPPRGTAQLPIVVRFVEDRAVVTGYSHPELGPATGLERGDVIERLGGASVDSLVEAWEPYYAVSNRPTLLRDVARQLTRGEPGPVAVSAVREDSAFDITAERVPLRDLDLLSERTHDLPGETFRMLSDEVAYLKLSSVSAADAADYVRRARDAQVLVIDIRNYPAEFVVFALGGHLVAEPTPFARFTGGRGANPGTFVWTEPVTIEPLEPRFTGKVVVLVDETSLSQAEYTAMAFRAAPGAIVAGSTTAGADGNVSPIPLPGRGVQGMISGIGVFYPDRTPTQRIGIVPDLEIRPTIEGIRAGRDEVLEAAVSHALGREFRLPPQEAPEPEATSLLGHPLVPAPIPPEARARMEAQLAEARAAYEADPDDADAIIWLGRRLAYLGRYRDAIAVFTEGMQKHPDDARMLRHRGHRHITVRELDAAIRDLSRARELMRGRPDEVEPDGMPNPAGIPRSTLKFNILYHLALAHYLKHDFERALLAWQETMEVSQNDDLRVATSDWLYMTLRRLGRDAEAARVLEPIRAGMEILENDAYHRRLLMYRGEIEPEALLDVRTADPVQLATYGYGVGNWYLYNGDEARAFEVFRRILEGEGWAAFGYIAAEAEMAARAGG